MRTLRSRLVLCYSVLVTLTVIATLALGYVMVRRQLIAGTDFLLDAEFEEISPKINGITQPSSQEVLESKLYDHTAIDAPFFFFQVRHHDTGKVLFRSKNLGARELPDLSQTEPHRGTVLLEELGLLRVSAYRSESLDVQIASSLNYLSGFSQRFFKIAALTSAAVLIFSVAIGYLLCEITLRPLRLIEQTARRINASNLSERIPLSSAKDEISRLTELLNEMFDRLEKSFEQVKQFTADFSHELRTPLSIVALHTERVLKKVDLDPSSVAALQEVLSETKRLNQIIDQLLTVAKAEAHALPLDLALHATDRFLDEFIEDATALAEASGLEFQVLRNEPLTARFDASWIRQVLFNLLSNAIKFSPPRGVIQLESMREADFWALIISDQGPGIPREKADSIFERFTQLQRSPDAPSGTGLGLAVSKSIVELHGGKIQCGQAPGGGTRMIIHLRISPSEPAFV